MNVKPTYIIFSIILLIFFVGIKVEAFDGGDGSVGDPYQISTCLQLQDINDDLTAHYILTGNVDCSGTTSWNSGQGFEPLGLVAQTSFTGTLNGQNYTISDLFFSRSVFSDGLGLFWDMNASSAAEIKNLTLEDVDFTNSQTGPVAGLVGEINGGIIENVHVTGTITSGSGSVAGVAKENRNIIRDSSFSGTLDAGNTNDTAGGIVSNLGPVGADILRSYSSGTFTADDLCGGIAGFVDDRFGNHTITDSYSTATCTTSGGSNISGGVAGYISGNGTGFTISRAYSAAAMTGDEVGGLVATTVASGVFTVTDSFWDSDVGPVSTVGGGTGTTTAAMKDIDTFTDTNTNGLDNAWDMVLLGNHDGLQATAVWFINDGTSYPSLYFELTVPGAPTGLSATAISSTQIDLSWTAPGDNGGREITGYKIERESPTGGGFSDLVADTGNTNTTYSDTGLDPGTEYNYRVSAINAVGTSTASGADSATTDAVAPDAPTGLTATAVSTSQIDLSWTTPADNGGASITGYKIERESPTGNGFSTLVADTGSTGTTYEDTGLNAGTQYNYKVRAINSAGTSVASDSANATTEAAQTTTSGSSASGQVYNLTNTGNFAQALYLMNQNPHLYTEADRQEVIKQWVMDLQRKVISLLQELVLRIQNR